MTPKEKAIKLVDKFYQTTPNEAWYNPPIGSISSNNYHAWEQAKQCAIIAVDEIIEATKTEIDRPDYNGVVLDKYWQEVKTELENL